MWLDEKRLSEIKAFLKQSAPSLSDGEFEAVKELCLMTGLNPYTKDVWIIPRGGKNQITIARDGYRKGAQRQPEYDYHYAEAIYSKDEFEVSNGVINHKFKFAERGELLGAYCIVKRKSSTMPIYCTASIKEYDKKQSLWLNMKETMIKKQAEIIALRSTFQEIFAGTYADGELPEEESKNIIIAPTELVTIDGSLKATSTDSNLPATLNQITDIETLMIDKNFTTERREKAFQYFKINSLSELTCEKADRFIAQLEKATIEK